MNWIIPILISVTVYVLYTRAHPAPQTSAQLNAITASEEAGLDSQERNYLAFRKIVNNRLGLSNFSRVSLIAGIANVLDEYINGPTTTTTTTKKPRRKRTTTTTSTITLPELLELESESNATLPPSIASQLDLASLLYSSMMLNTNGTIEIRVPASLVNSSDGIANIEQAIKEALLAGPTGLNSSARAGSEPTSGGGKGKTRTRTKPQFDPLGSITAINWLVKFVRSSNVIPWAWNNSIILLDTPPVHHAVKVVECQVWYNCDNSNELGKYVGGGS